MDIPDMMAPTPIVCPDCGNDDDQNVGLYIVSLDTERYYPTGERDEDGSPVFEYGKSVHAETSDDYAPTVVCGNCEAEWEIDWRDFGIG